MEQWKVIFDEGFYVIPKSGPKVEREVRVVIRQMQNGSWKMEVGGWRLEEEISPHLNPPPQRGEEVGGGWKLDKSQGGEIAVKGYEIVIQNGENREKEVVLINRKDILVGYGVMKLMELVNTVNHQTQMTDIWKNNKHFLQYNGYCEFCSRWFTEYYGVSALKKKCPSCHRMTRCMNERKVTAREKVNRYYLETRGARLFRGARRR